MLSWAFEVPEWRRMGSDYRDKVTKNWRSTSHGPFPRFACLREANNHTIGAIYASSTNWGAEML